jgi:hypothetical protein
MARTTITKTVLPGPYAADGVTVAMTAADVTNKNEAPLTGADLLIMRNANGAAKTYKLEGASNIYNRTADLSGSLAAGALAAFFFNNLEAFRQPDGMLYCEGEHADVKFGLLYGGGLI